MKAAGEPLQRPALKRSKSQKKVQVRKWRQQLLDANLLMGSMERGIHAHDLVRDCMVRRAKACDGGLCATQRDVVQLLLDAFGKCGAATVYVAASLHWHVREAQQPDVAVHADELLMRVLTHESADIRKQGAVRRCRHAAHRGGRVRYGRGALERGAAHVGSVCGARHGGRCGAASDVGVVATARGGG
jgi:hypothetical protein